MASLALTFSDLYNQVAKFLGTYGSTGPTGADLTDAKDVVHAAYRRFLSPPGGYKWSFLRKNDRIITVAGTEDYELEEDFSIVLNDILFDSDTGYPPLIETDWNSIKEYRAINNSTSYPEFFAIAAGEYTPETGQRWKMSLYPTPDAAYTLHYTYLIYPPKLSADADLHIGGPEISEVLKALCLAEAESTQDEVMDIQEKKAATLLQQAVANDIRRAPSGLGGNRLSSWDVARGSYRLNDVSYTTGY